MSADTMKISPLALIFPSIEGADFAALVDGIKKNGLINPIVINDQDEILDGRNRYKACLEAGVEPRFEIFEGDKAAQQTYVKETNITRRHLSVAERALIAAKLLEDNRHPFRQNPEMGMSKAEELQSQLGISKTALVSARGILKAAKKDKDGSKGSAEIVDLVRRGEVGLATAQGFMRGSIPKSQIDNLLSTEKRGAPSGQRDIHRLGHMCDMFEKFDNLQACVTRWEPDEEIFDRVNKMKIGLNRIVQGWREILDNDATARSVA